ncbi:MAG: hypothetical protein JJT75_06055 [Opitutales bacterium]|nr:hypothetical protein [Opitutales bacterium]MCH8541603.1 hypothetical protein [Opitutales bacterium]
MKNYYSLVCLIILFLCFTNAAVARESIAETIIPETSLENMTIAEASLQIKEDYYETTGEELFLFLSPELALSKETRNLQGKNLKVGQIVGYLAEMHNATAGWVDHVLIVSYPPED